MAEHWFDIVGFEGFYQISNLGSVRAPAKKDAIGRRRKARIMRPQIGTTGREVIGLRKNNRGHHRPIADLARETFVGPARRRRYRKFFVRNGKHVKARLYSIWVGMRNRCNNPNQPGFHNWGGKGVTICLEWGYDLFRQWAISNGYGKDLSIDRIDGNGNYEPDNCRWVTESVQAANKVVDPIGENNPRRKLTEDDVRTIRASDATHTALHKVYGVAITTIANIRNGKSWIHVQ
jgi:hypothetical protein